MLVISDLGSKGTVLSDQLRGSKRAADLCPLFSHKIMQKICKKAEFLMTRLIMALAGLSMNV